jgi:hypothetical protein
MPASGRISPGGGTDDCRPWVPALNRHPEGEVALPGYVWLDMPGKVRSVGEHELEFTVEVPAD